MSLNISLPTELEARVQNYVASGLYGSASEVVREALCLFDAYRTMQLASLASLKSDISQGMADVHAGRVGAMDMAVVKEKGRAVLKSKAGAT